MAKKRSSSKAKTSAEETSETIADKVETATEIEEGSQTPADADAPDDTSAAKSEKKTAASDDETATDSAGDADSATDKATDASDQEDPETAAQDASEESTADDAEAADQPPSDDADTASSEMEPVPVAHSPPPVTTEQVIIRKGGFVPMVLGGIVAAAIGFAVAHYGLLSDGPNVADLQASTTKALDEQSSALSDLSARIDGLPAVPDLSGIESTQEDLEAAVASLSDRVAAIESNLADLAAQVSELATRPLTEGASEAAVAAYEAELKKLQAAMAAQRAEIEAMTADAKAMEDNAEETAQATMRRAALTRIQTAIENGNGYAPALADLDAAGVPAPVALASVAQDGVASLVELQDSFPDAARAALTAARQDADDGATSGGLSAFLRNQLGARSLEPREGDDPDAVLSRAEAAVRDGRLTDALAEIEVLPDVGRAELSDWSGRAAQRLDALTAVQSLSENLN